MGNSFGKLFQDHHIWRITWISFGRDHRRMPAGLKIDEEKIRLEMQRRNWTVQITTQRKEEDESRFFQGFLRVKPQARQLDSNPQF